MLSASAAGGSAERTQPTATEYALSQLRQLLFSGGLAQGTRIDQAELAKRFGVSIVPIREALARLQSLGLVEIVPHRGVFVARVSADELIDIYTVREVVEEQAARIAAAKLTDADVAALEKIAAAMGAAAKAKDFARLLAHNRDLHFTIYRAAGRRHMLQIIERMWDLSARYAHLQLHAVPERSSEAMFEVNSILLACRRRDADALGLMVRYKVHQTTVGLLERMQLDGPDGALALGSDEAAKTSAAAGNVRAKRSPAKGRHAARAVPR
jgi:DNA-binding GntR family transcriptional regulator